MTLLYFLDGWMDGFISFIKDINKNAFIHDKRPLRLGEAHPGFINKGLLSLSLQFLLKETHVFPSKL